MQNQVIKILSEVKEKPELVDILNQDSSILVDANLDSLQLIQFMLRIEEVFGLEIDFETFDFSNLSSINSFCEYLKAGN